MPKFPSTLKIVSMLLGGIGMLIANELQRRETEEFVEKHLEEAIAKHEAAKVKKTTT